MELSPLSPLLGELLFAATNWVAFLLVAVASYRRSRCLSRYPVWRSLLIGVVAGMWWPLWLIVWWVNRERIAQEWQEYRKARQATFAGEG